MTLERFKIICKKCNTEALLTEEDNAACGDDECCGPREEWLKAECPNCKEEEDLRP